MFEHKKCLIRLNLKFEFDVLKFDKIVSSAQEVFLMCSSCIIYAHG